MAENTGDTSSQDRDRSTSGLSPDELEQRQRVDGTYEEDTAVGDDGPLDPDEIEQRQSADGSIGRPGALDEETDEPLDPDEIDQRRVVEDDEDDAPRET